MSRAVLELKGFGVAFGGQVVLSNVTFQLPPAGLTSLVGPAGVGKSTLLRTVAGLNDAHPSLTTWGELWLHGQRVGADSPVPRAPGDLRPGVGFVMQHARFFLDSVRDNLVSALPNRASLDRASQTRLAQRLLEEHGLGMLTPQMSLDVASLPAPLQRRLAVVLAVLGDPKVLFADEPAAGLDDADAIELLTLLRVQARKRAVLCVTHHQRFARASGGTVVLLAGGEVREIAPANAFFAAPASEAGRAFVRTGGWVSPPAPAAPAPPARSDSPRGFFWLWPGRLGGLPRPGIVAELDDDLRGLKGIGVTTLVTLEEKATVPPEQLEKLGFAHVHEPVPDMGVPSLDRAAWLCSELERRLQAGEVIAVHCRAGLGRTGTVLASQLVFEGSTAREAIERVRRLNPRCIQSQVQIEFLSFLEKEIRAVKAWQARSTPSSQPAAS
jgi:atypical dual specificity phosphatase